MSKLIYDKPVEIDGKMVISQEILTHFLCERCGKWPTASDVQAEGDRLMFCTYCGLEQELPPMCINLVGDRKPTQAEIDYGKTLESLALELLEETRKRNEFSERVIKSLDGDAGWPHFIDPGLMTR